MMSAVKPELHERAVLQVTDLAGRRAHENAWKHFAGAQTPEEIALAILAEIIMLRRGGAGSAKSAFVREK